MIAKDRLIVALDVDGEQRALELVEKLKDDVKLFKIGLELFSSCGPGIVEKVREKGCEVFLDLKFHDIPNTVAKAVASITKLKPFIFNVHSLGGCDMMRKAAESAKAEAKRLNSPRPKVLAVTILTSMDQIALKKIGVDDNMKAQVVRLAKLAKDSGLDGVVASPREARLIRENTGGDFLIVTPGVRPSWAAPEDQKRVATPKEAIEAGADYIIVGRPVIEAKDPKEAAKRILQEIDQ